MDIKNKVAVITGGASGLGAATAEYLAEQGAQLALLDYNADLIAAKAQQLNAFAQVCDVSQTQSVEQAIEKVVAFYQNIHILVNCAGIAPAARIVGRNGVMPLEQFSQVIQVNLIGTFNVLRVVAAHMLQQKVVNDQEERGVIINTASVAAYEGQIGQVAYSASKGGVVALTLPAARELGKFGVRVMTIAPGVMQTPMMQAMPDEVQENLAKDVIFPKRLGFAEEYAALVGHIIENCYLNGEVIRLDGAIRMPAK